MVVLGLERKALAEELIEHCRERLASFKVPKAVYVVEDFPRSGSGKIQKHRLREELYTLFSEGIS